MANDFIFTVSLPILQRLVKQRGFGELKGCNLNKGFLPSTPEDIEEAYKKFTLRQQHAKEDPLFGRKLELYVASRVCKLTDNPATFGNVIPGLGEGGDYDVLIGLRETDLIYVEVKSGDFALGDFWNFLVRDSVLAPEMAALLIDWNYDLGDRLIPLVNELLSLVYLSVAALENLSTYKVKLGNYKEGKRVFSEVKPTYYAQIYFMYWPILVMNGGDNLDQNLMNVIKFYHSDLPTPGEFWGGATAFRRGIKALGHYKEARVPPEVKPLLDSLEKRWREPH